MKIMEKNAVSSSSQSACSNTILVYFGHEEVVRVLAERRGSDRIPVARWGGYWE